MRAWDRMPNNPMPNSRAPHNGNRQLELQTATGIHPWEQFRAQFNAPLAALVFSTRRWSSPFAGSPRNSRSRQMQTDVFLWGGGPVVQRGASAMKRRMPLS